MDYWDEVMQDDVYLVVTERWAEAARAARAGAGPGQGAYAERPHLTVRREKYKMDLLPPELVVARYFVTERAEIDRLQYR